MRALSVLALATLLILSGCDNRKSFRVQSDPPGAQILVDGVPAGVTPSTVMLDTSVLEHALMLKRPGYLPYEQKVHVKPLLEGPTQHCAAVACSPCCAFVPLALCWERSFTPKSIDAALYREGQGIEVVCRPVGAEIWVDGMLAGQAMAVREETVEGNARVGIPADYGIAVIPLESKAVKVEVRAAGCQTQEMQVMIRPGDFIHLKLDLLPQALPKP